MLFNSLIFLFAFLPLVLGIYFLLQNKLRNIFLLIASLVFYAWGEGDMVVIMIFSICLNYVFGLLINTEFPLNNHFRKKWGGGNAFNWYCNQSEHFNLL